jgi:tetratricopeptide (TPR) repeat protein
LTANSFLSYFSFSLEMDLWIALAGILLPGLIALFLIQNEGPLPKQRQRGLPDPPVWLWVLFGALFSAAHLFHWADLPEWFLADEGRVGYYARDLAQKWEGRLFFFETQGLPLSIWAYGLFTKFVPMSAASLRIFPGILSALCVLAGYGGARLWAGRPAAFLTAWLLALSFWSFSVSRFCLYGLGLFLFLEIVVLVLLFRLFQAKRDIEKRWILGGLASTVTLEFYTMPMGKVLLAVVVLTLVFYFFIRKRLDPKYFLVFLFAVGVLAWPLGREELFGNGSRYITTQFAHGINGRYVLGLFWRGLGSAPYGPRWGGCFNSILTSLVLVGGLDLFRRRQFLLLAWTAAAFALLLLPGLLSVGMEMFRVWGVLPLLTYLAVLGLEALGQASPPAARWPVLAGLLLASGAMDFYHYAGPYQSLPQVHRIWRNANYEGIYRMLEARKDGGVSLGFLNLIANDYDDPTLSLCMDAFNRLRDPGVRVEACGEVAVVCDAHYQPFLQRRFPQARWRVFSDDTSDVRQNILLGEIRVDAGTSGVLQAWAAAGGAFRGVKHIHAYWQLGESHQKELDYWFQQYPSFKGDPFLESAFWEQAALLFNMERNLPYALACYQKAVRKGYPAAHLYDEMGALEALKGSKKEAEADFKRALAAPLNLTNAAANLKAIEKPRETNGSQVPNPGT